jgi:hypothetical protein
MIKNFFYSILLSITLFAVDTLTVDNLSAQKQDTLYVQNMIEIEENMEKLISDDYLGSNFSVINKMGENIDFKDSSSLKLKYAVTKDAYRKKRDLTVGINNYIVQLYNRDLYRNYTYAYDDTTDILKSYVEFKLESPEAKTIFKILNEGYTIAKTCTDSLKNTYCNYDTNSIRWYNSASNWIEYDKKNFEDGNVTILSSSVINDPKLDNLKVGVYIFIQNTSRYVKLIDNKILKVD